MDLYKINPKSIWYHGPNMRFSLLRVGSTVTLIERWRKHFRTSRRCSPVRRTARFCIMAAKEDFCIS